MSRWDGDTLARNTRTRWARMVATVGLLAALGLLHGCLVAEEDFPDGWVEPVWPDTTSGLIWQTVPGDRQSWDSARVYCSDLVLDGLDDWRLPTVDELRTLLRGCSYTELGGGCGVTGTCLTLSCNTVVCLGACSPDAGPGPEGCYCDAGLVQGAYMWFWSSSPVSDRTDKAWVIGFDVAGISDSEKSTAQNNRCVRGILN